MNSNPEDSNKAPGIFHRLKARKSRGAEKPGD